MTHIFKSRYFKSVSAIFMLMLVSVIGATPVFAVDENVTNEVAQTKAGTPWFYWPGWAFIGLLIVVFATVGYAWYKSIYIPKYRGQKVAQ